MLIASLKYVKCILFESMINPGSLIIAILSLILEN